MKLPPLPRAPLTTTQAAIVNTARISLPPIPPPVGPLFLMRVLPASDRPGLYEVCFEPEKPGGPYTFRKEYWDGMRWPGLAGNFRAYAWRGMWGAA